MNLFVCSSPFHVFNAISIEKKLNKSTASDMYILNIGENSIRIFNNLKDKKIFRNVYLIEVNNKNKQSKLFYYLNRLSKIIFTKMMIPNPHTKYDSVFIVGTEVFSKAIYAYWLRKNKSTVLYYFEDGTASYFDVLMENKKSTKDKLFFFLKGFNIMGKCEALYVYRPECVINTNINIDIKPIPIIDKTTPEADSIKEVFGMDEGKKTFNEVIFFDGNFGENIIQKKQLQFFKIIEKSIDKENIAVKLHPSSFNNMYGEKVKMIDSNVGFELFNLNHNMNNKVLISVISSANFTPKFIYNEEPYVIYLYKLIKNEKDYPYFDNFVNQVKKIYNNPEKIFVPETIIEFEKILKKLNYSCKESNQNESIEGV